MTAPEGTLSGAIDAAPQAGAATPRPQRGLPLAFDGPVGAPGLPLNYMPAALAALRGEPRGAPRSIIPADVDGAWSTFRKAEASELRTPEAWTEGAVLIGPPIPREPDGGRARRPRGHVERCFCRAADAPGAGPDARALVVVDHGIAFWNPRLCDEKGEPLFREIQVLDLDLDDGDLTVGPLRRDELCALTGLARAPGGEARVWRELGDLFPGSFFGKPHPPSETWHGTAMADIAVRQAGRGTLLYGVELPDAVVEDWGGDTLGAFLPTAFAAALELAAPIWEAGGSVTILLASGHQAGPHDGSHPAARALGDLLGRARARGRRVNLVLPMGNSLQHQGVARLDPSQAIILRVPADDLSPTTVEVCLPATGDPPTLVVEAPDGGCAEAPCEPGTFQALKRGGETIGGVHALPLPHSDNGLRRLRLGLAPTAWRHPPRDAPPAPCGDWRLWIEGATVPADLWILGDDIRDGGSRLAPRPATFAHPGWRDRDDDGDWLLDDQKGVPVRRRGSASVLTTAPRVHAAAALERRGERVGLAPYSALPFGADPENLCKEVVEDRAEPDDPEGTAALGSSLAFDIRISGTSVAAALAAGRLAAGP